MSNEEITALFHQVHNVFWRKWRDKVPDLGSLEWEEMITQGNEIMKAYAHHPLACHMVRELIDVMEDRTRKAGRKDDGNKDSQGNPHKG